MSHANAVVGRMQRLFADGRYYARLALKTKKESGSMTSATAMGISPFEAAIHSGRMHEREDVLKYLTLLAVSTKDETLWEAVNHIKGGKHKT